MAVTNAQILDFLAANPGMSDAQLVSAMQQYGVSPAQMSQAVGIPLAEVQQRYDAVSPPARTVAQAPVSNAQIVDFLAANPNMSDANIASAMNQYGISPTQMAQATGLPVGQVTSRLDAVGLLSPTAQTNKVIPTPRGTVIEGDNIEGQIAGIPQALVGTTPVSTTAQAPVTSQEIVNYLAANPGLSDADIVKAMAENKVSPAQLATAVGLPVGKVISRVALTVPQGSSVTLGDTRISPNYQVTGSGEDQQIGNLDTIIVEKTTGDINYKAPTGSEYQQYGADGTFQRTGVTQKEKSFFGGLKDAITDPVVLAALAGGAAAGGLFGGAGAAAGLGGTASLSDLALLDLSLGGAGGTAGATSLASALATGAEVGTLTNLTGGSGLLTGEAAGITAQSVADKLAADAAAQAVTDAAAKTAAELAASDAATKTAADAATKTAADAATKTAADLAAQKAADIAASELAAKTAADLAAAELAASEAAAKTAADLAAAEAAAKTAAEKLAASQAATLAAEQAAAKTAADLLAAEAAAKAAADAIAAATAAGDAAAALAAEQAAAKAAADLTAAQLAADAATKAAADAAAAAVADAAAAKTAADAAAAAAAADTAAIKAAADAAAKTAADLAAADAATKLAADTATKAAADAATKTAADAATKAAADAATKAAADAATKTAADLAAAQAAKAAADAAAAAAAAAGDATAKAAADLAAAKAASDLAAAKAAAAAAAAAAGTGTGTGLLTGVGTNLVTGALTSLAGGATGGLISGALGTAGNLLQMQQSKEAAEKAQLKIDAETAAAKQAAQFKPIGMTTRFGSSQFQTDPVTGQLTSAGYTLSPEAKAAQDRFVKLAGQGITQAEGAQAQFAPLQTGAQSLFNLGNQYISQSPQSVAQNYLNQQMALLQPGRELELATLQNKLQQQGRGGLSVAQGGTYGATTPELQALYNARARQEAELAANAQQLGQKDVLFGAGLLDRGSTAMGNYYSGQQAAYAPYTTALGEIKNLETLAQQPFTMSTGLAEKTGAAGAKIGQFGLEGAKYSTELATSADATRNLAAQSLIAAGNPNAQFGQALSGLFSGGLQSAFSQTPVGASGFGTGLAYGNVDLGLYL